jgi:hypothetical protein
MMKGSDKILKQRSAAAMTCSGGWQSVLKVKVPKIA